MGKNTAFTFARDKKDHKICTIMRLSLFLIFKMTFKFLYSCKIWWKIHEGLIYFYEVLLMCSTSSRTDITLFCPKFVVQYVHDSFFNAGINGTFPNSFTKPSAIQKGKLIETVMYWISLANKISVKFEFRNYLSKKLCTKYVLIRIKEWPRRSIWSRTMYLVQWNFHWWRTSDNEYHYLPLPAYKFKDKSDCELSWKFRH